MNDADDLLAAELKKLPPKPGENAKQSDKKRYSELMSAAAARALGEALRRKGLAGTLPLPTHTNRTTQVPDNGPDEETGE